MLFTADGGRAIHAEFQPDQEACVAKVVQMRSALESDNPEGLTAAGAFCIPVKLPDDGVKNGRSI